jgi:tol-pal system protein YbgF
MKRRLSALVLSALLPACFFPADRGRALEGRLDVLADDNQRLKTELAETREKLEKTTARLQDALDQLDKASRTTGANIGVKVDGAIQDVASLKGQVEGFQYKVTELEGKLKDMADTQAALKAKADATPLPEPKKDEPKKPDVPKDFLALADDKAKAGDLETARKLYAEFLKKWPKDELAGEAHQGLGETWFTDGKCREALYEYGKVIQDFPKSKSTPEAYLRSADCFKELKMIAEAKLALEELSRQFPKSEPAKAVKQRLADLEKKPKKGEKK